MKRSQPPGSRFPKALAWLGVAAGGAALLWWLADHRRGIRWARNAVRTMFPDVPHIRTADLAQWMADPARAPRLLDARTAEEFALSHLPGAELVGEGAEELLASLRSEARPIIAYCAAGYRGARLARRLRAAGIEQVANLDGGIFAWANEGRSVIRDGREVREVHPMHRLFQRFLHPLHRPKKSSTP